MKNTEELLTGLALEQIEINIFRGQSHSIGNKQVFGGQVLAQSVQAAMQTVPNDRILHSMHGYFILGGDIDQPIVYDVDLIRDGKSFTTRRVVAIQHGRAIFNMSASFQVAEKGIDHQLPMPDVKPPDALPSASSLLREYGEAIPAPFKAWLQIPRPIEFCPVELPTLISGKKSPPIQHVWFRAIGKLPNDEPRTHQTVLAYASDYNLLGTALRPHALSFLDLKMAASLDHAMWFHREFRADEWLLYALDSPSASNARGFMRGNIFSQDGTLIASVAQEALIRGGV